METEYLKIGESKFVDGEFYAKPGCYEDGVVSGCIYKDEEAYEKDWDAVCYIPEYAFQDQEVDEEGFSQMTGYTHNDLLAMCNGNREWCDYFFQSCWWAYPETYLHDTDDEDIACFYSFIKPGAKVWWNDPAGETSGEYTVSGVPFEFDDHGEPIEPESFTLDTVIIIGNDNSEAEVTPAELTPIYN